MSDHARNLDTYGDGDDDDGQGEVWTAVDVVETPGGTEIRNLVTGALIVCLPTNADVDDYLEDNYLFVPQDDSSAADSPDCNDLPF